MPDDAPPSPAVAQGPSLPEQEGGVRRNFVLAACLMATFMAAVESSIVATAIPTLVGDLGGFSLFSWVFTIYLLTQAVSIPVYGRLADLFGRKRIFYIGAGVFLLGSTLCGFAWSMPVLIGFRALQGFGAGGVQPIASTILGDIYAPAERAKIQGLVSSAFGVSAVAGPSLGAFLISHFSWAAVFWVNLPVGAAAITMIALLLHEDIHKRSHRIDWLGSVLLLASVGLLMIALVQGATMDLRELAALIVAGVVALCALYWHERRTPEPMLPLELWRLRLIAVGSLGNGTAGAVITGIAAFLPTYIQGAMGGTPLMAGSVLGAMSVSWALLSIAGGRLMLRTSYRLTAVLGALGLCVGCAMLQGIGPEDGPWPAAVAAFIVGGGMGFCSTSFIVSVQTSVPWHQRGAATSSTMFMRFIGQSLGAAGCAAVLNFSLRRQDPTAVDQVRLLLEPSTRAALPADRVAHLVSVVSTGLHHAYALTLVAGVATLWFASLVPRGVSPRAQVDRR